jgi:hypothetical protein
MLRGQDASHYTPKVTTSGYGSQSLTEIRKEKVAILQQARQEHDVKVYAAKNNLDTYIHEHYTPIVAQAFEKLAAIAKIKRSVTSKFHSIANTLDKCYEAEVHASKCGLDADLVMGEAEADAVNTYEKKLKAAFEKHEALVQKALSQQLAEEQAKLLAADLAVDSQAFEAIKKQYEVGVQKAKDEYELVLAEGRYLDHYENPHHYFPNDIDVPVQLHNAIEVMTEKFVNGLKDVMSFNQVSKVPETNIFNALSPPEHNIAKFMANTVFNAEAPISHIIAMGSLVPYYDASSDFCNYFSSDKKYISHTPVRNTDNTTIIVATECNIAKTSTKPAQSYGSNFKHASILETHLQVQCDQHEPRTATVTFIDLPECVGFPRLDFAEDSYKDIFWSLYKKTQKENTLIHNDTRSGYLILMFEIVRQYADIFADHNPQYIADKLTAIVKNIRAAGAGLIANKQELRDAIHNGHVLYHYGMAKEHKLAKANASSADIFKAGDNLVQTLFRRPISPCLNGMAGDNKSLEGADIQTFSLGMTPVS